MLNSVMSIAKLILCALFCRQKRLWLSIDAVNHALKNYPKINFKAEKVRSFCSSEKFSGVRITSSDHSITAKKNRYRNFDSLLNISEENVFIFS